MKNSWLIWLFIVAVVITVLVAFNYQGNKAAIPLSEIFPEEKTMPTDVEYEFVDSVTQRQPAATTTTQQAQAQQPAQAIQQAAATAPAQTTPTAAKEVDLKQVPFTIQIASFKTKDAAQTNLNKILEKGYDGFIVSKNLGEKGTWHRIYVGIFQTKPQAEEILTKVKQDYPSSFIITPK
ncbi:MAG TPA: SPOR domain-containing protein [Candidatus Omnitrophota bacterium]|nr:SPOR domain-containing protein [Candidatus Omnitrophota bacterium]